MSFFLFILFFIIAIILLGLSVISSVIRTIFGLGRRSSSSASSSNRRRTMPYDNQDETETDNARKHKKIFDKEDGEYVDFEEVKENEK